MKSQIHQEVCMTGLRKTAFVFSGFYALALVFGYIMYETNSLAGGFCSVKQSMLTISAIVLIALALGFLMLFVLQFVAKQRSFKSDTSRLYCFFTRKNALLYIWAIIFCCWLPCYLAYFPGVFSYDIITQTAMIMGDIPYSTIVPPMHTFIWVVCVQIQEVLHTNNAIVFYSLFQMLVFSAMLARIVVYTGRKTGFSLWPLLTLIFFALNPVVAIMSFSTTKAVIFAGFFALLAIEIWELVSDPEAYLSCRRSRIRFIVIAILACLFRGNAFGCLILLIPFAVKLLRENRKRVIEIVAVPVVLYLLINSVVFPALGFEKGSNSELVAVPIQQMANVVSNHQDELSEEELSLLSVYYGCGPENIADNYNPRFADPLKSSFHVSGSKLPSFVKLWLSLGLKYPGDYLDAFLTLNLPYWYQHADAVDAFSQRQYIETSLGGDKHFGGYGYYWFFRDSKLPVLYGLYEKAADYSMFRNIPVISSVFSLSFPIWFIAFCLALLKAKGMLRERLVLLPSLFQCIIFLFGPVSNFRYVFPVFILYPVFAAICFGYNNIVITDSKNS